MTERKFGGHQTMYDLREVESFKVNYEALLPATARDRGERKAEKSVYQAWQMTGHPARGLKTYPGLLHPSSSYFMSRYATYGRRSPDGFFIFSDCQAEIQEVCVARYRTPPLLSFAGLRKLATLLLRYHKRDLTRFW